MKPLAACLLGALLMAASGCLRVNNALTINEDGSGTIHVKYSVSNQAIRQLDAMRRLQNQMAGLSTENAVLDDDETRYAYMFLTPNEADLRRELDRYQPLGISVETLKITPGGAWQNVEIKLLFENLARLAEAEPFKFIGFDLVRNSQGAYVFHRQSSPREGFTPPNLNDPATARLVSPIFNGFRVQFSLRTPGRIIRTNAPRKSTYTSEWVFDFDQDPAAITHVQTARLVTIFDSAGLDLPEIRR